jgi:hypothetical protein
MLERREPRPAPPATRRLQPGALLTSIRALFLSPREELRSETESYCCFMAKRLNVDNMTITAFKTEKGLVIFQVLTAASIKMSVF